MRLLLYLLFSLSLILSIASGCHKGKQQGYNAGLAADVKNYTKELNALANSIDRLIPESQKQQSLIFSRDNYSFYVSRYILDSKVSLYVETGIVNSNDFIEKKYYLKDGKIFLFIQNNDNVDKAADENIQRTYFKNGKIISRTGEFSNSGNLLNLLGNSDTRTSKAFHADLLELKDAIYQQGNFSLNLEAIAEYPKTRYLILSKQDVNAYRAALKVENPDQVMKLILSNPAKYKGRKIDVTWKIREPFEAVYTSGSLN